MEYTEKDLEILIEESISECDSMPYLCTFVKTQAGRKRVIDRIKQHIFSRGIDDVETAMALVEMELATPSN